MDNKLTSRIAIITGAAQGIGAAIAQRFVQEGCFVYVTDVNDVLGRATVKALGDRACYLDLDVRSEKDWQRVTTHVLEAHGRLDVVVNNAGITGFE
ncbi:SDR family NAD(P)-dependent oxidoreductase, partial [Pseudomonas viridiflava]